MKPDTRTVMELFERDVRYVVPLYQRPYVWTQVQQWEPLWEDIRLLLEPQMNSFGETGATSHFLGAIVLDQETQAPGAVPMYTVIDGQQRLTTLQILLAAGSKVAAEYDAPADAGLLRDLVTNDPRKADGDERFKVWPTNVNRAAFKAVVEGGAKPSRVDDPNNQIDEAYTFFTSRLREWVAENVDGDSVRAVRRLRVTLSELLKMVSITLEGDDNAQVIFETLNARGTPLLALDLVKNAVFHETTRRHLNTDELYEGVWKPEFDEADRYWRKELRQGRLFRPRADLFLMHWLTMRLHVGIPASELFTTFRSRVLQAVDAPPTDELVREFCRDAKTMRSFDHQATGSVEASFFERLDQLDVSTVLPLVLFLFCRPEVTADRRRRALQILESWLARRALLRLTNKNYNMQVPVLVGRVAEDPSRPDELLLRELRAGSGEISRWPTDVELIDYFEQHDAYNNIPRARLAMALAAVEQSLYSKKSDVVALPKSLTLEHVMPQSWAENWPLPEGLSLEEYEAAEESRSHSIHKLGNLTLVAQALNASLSNAAWPAKQVELNRETRLLLNARLMERYRDCFDEAAIATRTRELAEAICKIWPGPEADWIPGAPTYQPPEEPRTTNSRATALAAVLKTAEPEGESPRVSTPELGVGAERPPKPRRSYAEFCEQLLDEARQEGELAVYAPTPENVVMLKDDRNLRWERVAIRVFGDPGKTPEVRLLYDAALGEGASRERWGAKTAARVAKVNDEARAEGELGQFEATPENAVFLHDERGLRWERVAARIFGDAARGRDVRRLYAAAKEKTDLDG